MIKLTWKKQGGYGETYVGFAGDIRCFTVSYSATKPHGDPNPYTLSSHLPGIETICGGSRNDLMTKAHFLLLEWLKRIGVEVVIQ